MMPEEKYFQRSHIILLLSSFFCQSASGLQDTCTMNIKGNISKKKNRMNLSAIADLKVRQIVNWRKERMGDAKVILKTT